MINLGRNRDSEMQQMFAEYDWAQSELGPMEHWPVPLQSAVSLALTSSFPIVLFVGSELTMLYNDAWRPVAGDKHPYCFARPGAEVWQEIWDVIGAMLHEVINTGKAKWVNDILLVLYRYG